MVLDRMDKELMVLDRMVKELMVLDLLELTLKGRKCFVPTTLLLCGVCLDAPVQRELVDAVLLIYYHTKMWIQRITGLIL
jgi:hypothetical protein